jgi:hypothetical protein
MDFHEFMTRYTMGLFGLIKRYCDWAESQAKSRNDLLLLGLGPIGLLGLMLWMLPAWLGKTIALILLAPVLYVAYIVFQHYASRDDSK